MKERIKIIAGVLSFAMVFGIFASCGGNSNSADENSDSISDTAEIPNSSVETVESPWTEEPAAYRTARFFAAHSPDTSGA